MTLPTDLAILVEAGMMFWTALQPSPHSFSEGPFTVFFWPGGQAVLGAKGIADNLEKVVIILSHVSCHHKQKKQR